MNDANGVYGINPTTISASQAANGATVTVTYAPTTFGNHTASVVISGGGANPVTVNLNGTANITKYAPVMLQPNDAYVALTRFRAEWTDETPTFNVASYTLEVSPKPAQPGGANTRLITDITPDQHYFVVTDLTAGGTFSYKVKALYIDGTESDWSNIEEVTLHENAHPYAKGDVTHDEIVDIDDVTTLITGVLGNGTVCPICGDVTGDNLLDIDDVTNLIDMILGNSGKKLNLVVRKPLRLRHLDRHI